MNDRILGYFLENHVQGLFPPNNYFNELIYYDDDDHEHEHPLLLYDWTKELKKHFNNVIYTYYYDRLIFFDKYKFPVDDSITTYNNLRKQIAYILESKAYEYGNLYESTILEFNPLWNVDGTETTSRTLVQTGTDANARTGSDTSTNTGSDVTTGQRTTYDTSFLDTDKSTLTHGHTVTNQFGSTDTETRNLRDEERITLERHGNIGVISTVKLIQEYRELSEFDYYKFVTHDIVNNISYGVC